MKRIALSSLLLSMLLILSACVAGGPKVDPGAYQVSPADVEKIQIPAVCQSSYKIDIPRVAIVEFQNNTTYGKMTATNTHVSGQSSTTRKSAAVAGVVATPVGIGVGGVSASKTDTNYSGNIDSFMREIAPNIGTYAQSAVENTMSGIGGMKIYDRSHLQKIMNEQKFQMTIGDPNTAVQLGKMAGVQYIITGTVDNITTKYVEKIKDDKSLGSLFTLASIAVNTQAGWNVNVEMTIKLLDVATGEQLLNKKVTGHEVAGNQPNFNPEMSITAAKKAMGEAVEDLRPDFSQRFAQRGYIQQLRGNKTVALINLGSDKGITAGTKVDAYDFIEIVDPFTNVATCNMSKIPLDLTVSDQVTANQAWVQVKGDPEQTARLKLGVIVKRQQLKGQGFMKKLF
ncbi:hypothetical protein Dacet_1556 [Denitrovibrio acetiphilus DSM 12809]|uniref:Curli production assembly/transport component CsgG n=1 Tax=Denitrovibrio acetiphilus (strain DSM 12809 / NBRC 114555 / N2460) TaxID=522772 RepID=D4H8H6_DENA2|nr:CsgG/HfaB family protein [Denitrovibrio acetiphilus]ADD68325.1 hypothetical protein Dacet_1556 [Denitrovibrio acetiphilus DSM 12809]